MSESACDHFPRQCLQVTATMGPSPSPVPEDWLGYQVYHCLHPSCGVYWITPYLAAEFHQGVLGGLEVTEAEAMRLAYPRRKSE